MIAVKPLAMLGCGRSDASKAHRSFRAPLPLLYPSIHPNFDLKLVNHAEQCAKITPSPSSTKTFAVFQEKLVERLDSKNVLRPEIIQA
ncbi:hypothetical protein M407DRAFT_107070 [Tulasnella calospora MUT 4182]|uniref:Uncharacterized protein n=1 Tax=Tulasnella calospora MUT 4182 TaxID=1051891 RepID=A0A0C3QDQ8_9AGAM|nr:hypothetical protein M407DRAFT_107070 [Tulasnella calospora MUT 4182]